MKDESWVVKVTIFFSSRDVWVVRHEGGVTSCEGRERVVETRPHGGWHGFSLPAVFA